MDKDHKDRIISALERAIREMKAGHTPKFLLVIYPPADRKGTEVIMGYTTHDPETALQFNEIMEETSKGFRQRFALEAVGLDATDFESIKERYVKDVEQAKDRALDGLQRDKPIKDLTVAQELLKKILSRGDDDDT